MDATERAWRRERLTLVIGGLLGLGTCQLLNRLAGNAVVWITGVVVFLAGVSALDKFVLRPIMDTYFRP